jgi:hypothetical protein
MGNLKGLASFVAELKARKTSLVDELRHVDAGFFRRGRVGRRKSGHLDEAIYIGSFPP